jgi:hypothetical protein
MNSTPSASEPTWIQGGGVGLTPSAILLELKLGGGQGLLEPLLSRKLAAAQAVQAGIQITPEELEEGLAEFYVERDLFEERDVESWRQGLGLELEAVRQFVRERLLASRFYDKIASKEAVEERFRAHLIDYDRAEVEVFRFPTEGAAREFVLSVREGERQATAGEKVEWTRKTAPEAVASEVFSAKPGDLLGPSELDDGTTEVYRLIESRPAQLDDPLRDEIRREIIRESLQSLLSRDPVRFLK